MIRYWTAWAVAFAIAGLSQCAIAHAEIVPVARTGDSLPDGPGHFTSTIQQFVLGRDGRVAFGAILGGTLNGADNDRGVYIWNGKTIDNVAREGQSPPEGNGEFSRFSTTLHLHSAGALVFVATLRNSDSAFDETSGLYRYTGAGLVEIARNDDALGDTGESIGGFRFLDVNDNGQTAFLTQLRIAGPGEWGVVLNTGPTIDVLARHDDPVPGGSGTLRLENAEPNLNANGQVVFEIPIFGSGRGLFLHNGSELVKIVQTGDLTPDGNRHFVQAGPPLINGLGHVAFNVDDADFNPSDGVWLYNGSGLVEVVPWGANAPDGNGTLYNAVPQDLNDLGQITVSAPLSGTAGGTNDDRGLFLYDRSNLVTLAREGAPVPGGNGEYAALGSGSTIHNSGVAVFSADLRNTTGDTSDNYAIYLSDGKETIEVARKGDVLGGRTAINIHAPAPHRFRRQSNEFGQVLIRALFDDGHGLFIYTPDLHWRAPTSGDWEAKANWTVSLLPSAPHKVIVDPADDVTVTGPTTSVTVKSLTVGGGAGQATLILQPGGTIDSTDAVTVSETGVLAGNGVIVGDVVNSGSLSPGTSVGTIEIDGDFQQSQIGRLIIELSTTGNDQLFVTGHASLAGSFELLFADGYLPRVGQSFEFLSAATFSGAFDSIILPDMPGAVSVDPTQLVHGILAFVPEPSGCTIALVVIGAMLCSRKRII